MPLLITDDFPARDLLTAAEAGRLNEIPAREYLKRVKARCGSESAPYLDVTYLWCLHKSQLPSDDQRLLEEIATTLCEGARSVHAARPLYDPVGYLRALVILRLLGGEEIAHDFEDAAQEWLFHEWGCGAHLTHTSSLRDDLAALLLLDPTPPPFTDKLFARLVRLEEARVEEPRPLHYPNERCLRECLEDTEGVFATQARLGLREKLPPPTTPQPQLAVPCFGGAVFQRNQSSVGILQTVSRTPLLPGLPPSLRESLWPVRRHYLNGELGRFSDQGNSWRTYTLQDGRTALALRLLEYLLPGEKLTDCWADTPSRPRGIHPHCLSHPATTTIKGCLITVQAQTGQEGTEEIKESGLFSLLWAISLDGEIVAEPTVTPARVIPSVPRRRGEEAWDIDWELPGGLWKIRVDPLAKEPLRAR
jgi:hypothetical protein